MDHFRLVSLSICLSIILSVHHYCPVLLKPAPHVRSIKHLLCAIYFIQVFCSWSKLNQSVPRDNRNGLTQCLLQQTCLELVDFRLKSNTNYTSNEFWSLEKITLVKIPLMKIPLSVLTQGNGMWYSFVSYVLTSTFYDSCSWKVKKKMYEVFLEYLTLYCYCDDVFPNRFQACPVFILVYHISLFLRV